MTDKSNTKDIETKYNIFEIREGLLKIPKDSVYGRAELIFDEYDSRKEAEEAISECDGGTYVILPLTRKIQAWEKEG